MRETSPSRLGFQRSFARETPRVEIPALDPAALACSSHARAPCHTPLVDFCHPHTIRKHDPRTSTTSMIGNRAPCGLRLTLLISSTHVTRDLRSPRERRPCPARAQPSFSGSEASCRLALSSKPEAPTCRDGSRQELCPNPTNGSDTPCRPTLCHHGWSRRDGPRAGLRAIDESRARPGSTAFAGGPSRAASHAASRKEACFAAPEVPSRA
jgi:hypothetical protein